MFGDIGKTLGIGSGGGTALGAIGGGLLGGPMGAMIGASIGGGFDSSSGQAKANKQNMNLAKDQMAFQERMSSTAHQRQVADLKAAGLNPILSVNSGASAPSGATANMQNEEQAKAQAVQQAAATALQARKLNQDLKVQTAQEKQISAQTRKTNTETSLLKANEPQARLKNKAGTWIEKQIDGLSNSAKSIKRKNSAYNKWKKFDKKVQEKPKVKKHMKRFNKNLPNINNMPF